MEIPEQIKTDNVPAYVSSKIIQLFAYYNKNILQGIPHNPIGKEVI